MHRFRCFVILLLFASTGLMARGQKTTAVQELFSQLKQPKTTDAAARAILDLASKDPDARAYVAQRLPAIVKDKEVGSVWLNAVRLAGQLKSQDAIPVLIDALSRGSVGEGSVTIAEYMRLDTDVVAKALVEIGDPSVPAVAGLLKQGDKRKRYRAALILLNINTPLSKTALREHLPNETESDIKKIIEDGIQSPK